MAAGFILGWKGNEEEEVDIGGSDADEPEEEGAVENASSEATHSLRAADSLSAKTSSNSPKEGATENAPRPPATQRWTTATDGNSTGKDSRELPGESDNQAEKRDEDPAAAAEKLESNANGFMPPPREDVLDTNVEDDQPPSRKRTLEPSPHLDHKRRKSDDWKTSQWVACLLCKRWRRIPFEVDVDRTTWQCKKNIWNSAFASCDSPQEEADIFDNLRAVQVDLPNTPCKSDSVLLLNSFASNHKSLEDQPIVEDAADKELPSLENEALDDPVSPLEPSAPDETQAGVTGSNEDARLCQLCGLGGEIISCCGPGCANRYHMHCLAPPLTSFPTTAWFCDSCYSKVESIWLLRHDHSDGDKLYRVKWKDLAHVHDNVLTEAEVTKLAPKRMSLLQKKPRYWEPEWAVPERIIGKREVHLHQIEWYVKWKGLAYEKSTWESATARVLTEETGRVLINRYESWCEKAKLRAQGPQSEKALEHFVKLEKQPEWMKGVQMQLEQLEVLNILRDCWCQQKNGIILNFLRKEETLPVVAFVVSLFREFGTQEPVLVVTSTDLLSFWEKKLGEWTPDLNTIKYLGSTGSRQVIQRHEFDFIGGFIKVNIVLSTLEIVSSDVEFLRRFMWSSLLIQNSNRFRKDQLQNISKLPANFCLLFVPEQLKDYGELDHITALLKRKDITDWQQLLLCQCRIGESDNLSEIWVPVQMSAVQIHYYCLLLVDHFELLRSGNICAGDKLLHEFLPLLRNCCCHPYLVSETLKTAIEELVPPAELLHAGIKASGKLELMHKMMMEFHEQKKKVLILVQSSKLMDILDDYLRQQFQTDSFGRIEKRMDAGRRKTFVSEFNSPDSSLFALLIQRSATAHVSDQSNAVDAVFIFESDWNPSNDMSYLRKLGINKAAVYRLYNRLTIEEKILDAARQGLLVERQQLYNMSARVFQEIIRWGVMPLLQIDGWITENDAYTDPRIGWNMSTLSEEIKNFLFFLEDNEVKALTSGCDKSGHPNLSDKLKEILSPRDSSARGAPLFGVTANTGEGVNYTAADDFWTPLIKDKHSKSLQLQKPRTRKHVEYGAGEDQIKQKKRKPSSSSPQAVQTVNEADATTPTTKNLDADAITSSAKFACADATPTIKCPSDCNSTISQKKRLNVDVSQGSCGREPTSSSKSQREEQLQLLDGLKAKFKSLCNHLKLQEDVSERANELLVFVMKNLRMDMTFLQEVEISLCWIAAEEMNVSFDKVEAIAIATAELGFDIHEKHLESVHEKLVSKIATSFHSGTGQPNDKMEAPDGNKRTTQVSPRGCLNSSRVDDNNAEGCNVQKLGTPSADILESRKKLLRQERSERSRKILENQKLEWRDFLRMEKSQKESLQRKQEAERRRLLPSQTAARVRLMAEHAVQVQQLEERLQQNKDDLGRRQGIARSMDQQLIASRLEQLEKGILPDPLPPLELSKNNYQAEERLDHTDSSANFHQQQRMQQTDHTIRRRSSRTIQPREWLRLATDGSLPQHHLVSGREAPATFSTASNPAAAAVNRSENLSLPASGNGVSSPDPTPMTEKELPASRNDVPVPETAPVGRTVDIPLPASRNVVSNAEFTSVSGREVDAPRHASRNEEAVFSVGREAESMEEIASTGRVQEAAEVSPRESGACDTTLPVSLGEAVLSRNEVAAAVNRGDDASIAGQQSPAEAPSGQNPWSFLQQQPRGFMSVPPVHHLELAGQQYEQYLFQQRVDPLLQEEHKLQNTLEKLKKAHEDEVARLTQKIEEENRIYAQKVEAVQNNLLTVNAHRRLAEALRSKGSLHRHQTRSPAIVVRGPPEASSTAASVWHNSLADFTAIAARPPPFSPPFTIAQQQHCILRIPAQNFHFVPPHAPSQQAQLFAASPRSTPSTPATTPSDPARLQQLSTNTPSAAPPFGSSPPAAAPPFGSSPAAAASPAVMTTAQELQESSQNMYRSIGENLRNACLPRQATLPGGTGSLADVVDPPATQAQAGTFFPHHPLESRTSLRQGDYICLSDDE